MEYVAQNATELVLLDYATQEPVLYLPEAHVANLDVAGDYKLTSGGQQGLDILGWNRASGNSFVIYTPLLSMKFLELSTGSTLRSKTNDTITEIEQIEVDNTDEFETSYSIENIKVYQLNQSGRSILNKLTVEDFDDTTVTLASATDGWLLVIYETIDNTQELLVGKFQNKGFFSLLGEIDVYNRNDAIQEKLKFNFPKIDIINSFNVKILNNTDTNQMFAIQCQALVEESIDKSLIRIIKRRESEPITPIEEDEWTDPVTLYSYGNKSEDWYLTAYDEGSYVSHESNHMIVGNKGYAVFRIEYRPGEEEEFVFYPPLIPGDKYTKVTITYEASGVSSSALAVIDSDANLISYMDLELAVGETVFTGDLLAEGVEIPTEDIGIAFLAYADKELKIYEVILHN